MRWGRDQIWDEVSEGVANVSETGQKESNGARVLAVW